MRRAEAVNWRLATRVTLGLLDGAYTLTASQPSRPHSFNIAFDLLVFGTAESISYGQNTIFPLY